MRIKTRLLLLLIPAIVLALGLLTFFSYRSAYEQAEKLALAEAESIALKHSILTFDKLQQAEAAVSTFASVTLKLKQENNVSRGTLIQAVKGLAESSPDFFGAWLLWEKDAYDGRDWSFVGNEELGNTEGRANAYWLRKGGQLQYDISNDYDDGEYYTLPKQAKKLTIIPPYLDKDSQGNAVLMTSLAMPVMHNGVVLGVAGIDIDLKFLTALIKDITPYDTGYAMLISDKGTVIATPKAKGAGDEAGQQGAKVPADILEKIRAGKSFSTREASLMNGEAVRCLYNAVHLPSFEKPWFFMVALPEKKIMAASEQGLLVQLGVGLGALAVLVVLVFYTAGGVSGPLQRIAAYAQEVARGNHQATLDSRGFPWELQELRSALGTMLDSLLGSMQEAEQRSREANRETERARDAMAEAEKARNVSEANHKAMVAVAGRVEAVAQKLQRTSSELTGKISVAGRETDAQTTLMEETVGAVAHMAGSIRQVAGNAGDAEAFAERTRARATAGADIVKDTLEAFESIRREAEALGAEITDLGARTEGIGSILDMINDIADQTNLLALNAAIEAARAGEAGRGFAVVADEVRKLAEKTMQATRQVDEAISGIRKSMEVSAEGVSRTAATVNRTVTLGHEARASLTDIVELVQGMSDQIHGIASLCQEQSATSSQVTGTVDRLRELSHSVAGAMSEGAAITRTLEPEAKELGLLVEQLTAA